VQTTPRVIRATPRTIVGVSARSEAERAPQSRTKDGAVSAIGRLRGTPRVLNRLALANLLANVGIVVTGGAVRLTGSGLGCPTWPRCTDRSYVVTPEMGLHGAIEFGNRMLTWLLVGLAAACLVGALLRRPRQPRVRRLAVLVFAGIPAQAVLGGVTVLTNLNPWVVAGHFLLSAALIAVAYQLWFATSGPALALDAPVVDAPAVAVPGAVRSLAWLTTGASAAVLVAGTVVTGSGPHAGDVKAHRTGLDAGQVAQFHSDLVFLLVGLSVALWYALRAVAAAPAARRAALVLIGVELSQGAIGFVQYFTHLPVLIVGAHMAGACCVWIATLAVLNALAPPPSLPRSDLPPSLPRDLALVDGDS